ncbi:ATP-binding cassette domain-containing protein [Candidatus Poribacteria bacterium]|nr:ATP-binding cassette domain-containing protein [Candidatus Poribacteria bacterium]
MIIFNNVNKNYGITNQALNGIDIKINLGELVFLVGAPGSGKSSILRLVTGIDKPTKGQVTVKGRILSAISYRGLTLARREMGIIMEEFNLFPELTLQENIELPLRVFGVNKKDREKQVQGIIDKLGLVKKKHFLARELSYQEKKIGMLARALVTDPTLIIGDEPWESLEPEWAEKVIQKIAEAHDRGATVVIAVPQYKIANDFPKNKRIITLLQGKIVKDEIAKDITGELEGMIENA